MIGVNAHNGGQALCIQLLQGQGLRTHSICQLQLTIGIGIGTIHGVLPCQVILFRILIVELGIGIKEVLGIGHSIVLTAEHLGAEYNGTDQHRHTDDGNDPAALALFGSILCIQLLTALDLV